MQPFIDSRDVLDDGAELQKRMERDGYLFISGLLPADTVERLRLKQLGIGLEEGWVSADAPLEDGVADLNGFGVEPEPEYMRVIGRMTSLQEFYALVQHPNLIGMFERMFGESVLPHAKVIGRCLFPQREAFTTPPHQDYVFIRGTAETYTAWIPLQDLPPEMGGLQIAAGSHKNGIYDYKPALGAGGMGINEPLQDSWVNNPFKQGDALIFHSMVVHKGVPCTGERLRLSIDARYQRLSEPIGPGNLTPHAGGSWEQIYAGWQSDDFKYYWKQWNLEDSEYRDHFSESDAVAAKVIEERDKMAFEMGENGDANAISALQRIMMRDGNPEKRQRAAELLETLRV